MTIWKILSVFFTSASPVFELRAGIPLALFEFDFPWYAAFLVAFFGNLFPVPILLLYLDPLSRLLSRIKLMERIFNWIFERSRRRGRLVERYGKIGLVLLVAIPLPMTGAWTGSFVAYLFDMPFWKSLLYVFVGVLIAGAVVSAVTVGAVSLF